MQSTARAHPNIALIKYWGKRNTELNLPAAGSISITLAELSTDMSIEIREDLDADRLMLNGALADDLLPRLSRCVDSVLGTERPRVSIRSSSNFPVAAGLASSASAFAACVVAADALDERPRSLGELANLAGRASGSAARSLYGGFAELENESASVCVRSLLNARDWPLEVVVAVTSDARKTVGSGEAMELSRKTSPFYAQWLEQQPDDLDEARAAIGERDFARLGDVAEHNCLKMHSVMWSTRPPMVYWTRSTISCMETVRELRQGGVPVFFTIDAGPQVKAVCTADAVLEVERALGATDGVLRTLRTPLGEGARLIEVD